MKPVVAVPAVMTGFFICCQTMFVALHPTALQTALESRMFEVQVPRDIPELSP